MKTLCERQSFVEWLDEQWFLQDAFIDSVVPLPQPSALPDQVRIAFRIQTAGGISAGEQRNMREIILVATDVSRFELLPHGFVSGNCCQGADIPEDSSAAIAFRIDVPLTLRLDCERLDVVEREWTEVVPEFLSSREFFITVKGAPLPAPEQWVQALKVLGVNVAWRCFGGPAVPVAYVPNQYEGWFLQQTDRIDSTSGGVFFFTSRGNGTGFEIQLQRHDAEDDPVWSRCSQYLGNFKEAEVHCGNAKLSGSAWLARIANM